MNAASKKVELAVAHLRKRLQRVGKKKGRKETGGVKVNGDGPPALEIRGDCRMAMDWISRKAREGRKYREAVKGIPNNDLAMVG